MDMGWMVPVGVVAAISARGAFTTWVRAKHGYPLEDRAERRRMRRGFGPVGRGHQARYDDGADELEAQRKIELLSSENERLTGQIGRLEERLRVLERIATDPAERTAREIEALRDS